MSGSVNKVTLVGRLGRDPEMRSTQDGQRIANINLATSETWKDRVSGERKERTEWHRIVVFNDKLAEIVEKYVRKGDLIHVEGALQTRKWTDNDGVERYITEVVLQKFRGEINMLSNTRGGDATDNRNDGYEGAGAYAGGTGGFAGSGARPGGGQRRSDDDLDDSIPF